MKPSIATLAARLAALQESDATQSQVLGAAHALIEAYREELADRKDVAAKFHALQRLVCGERLGVSTGIDERMTYGYGRLDEHGFWEYPLSEQDIEEWHKTKGRLLRRRDGVGVSDVPC